MTKNSAKPLILVDGSSYLYRAFHALPALTNSKGQPTGAIYGMIAMLRRLIADYQPEYMAVVFDSKQKTFRDDLYEHYKANRTAMPDELIQQIEPIHAAIRAQGLPLIMIEGVEADDVIGTLAVQATAANKQTIISTGDKDLAQLVNDHVTLINTMTNTVLNSETVLEKFGVPPERIIDYLTLVGDTSDNVPGVPQVGPKTAAKWLKEYGSLEQIIKSAEKISGKVGENLRSHLSQIPLTKSLVTIKLDVELPLTLETLQLSPPDKEKLIQLYKDLEFKTWLSELLAENPQTTNADKYANYEIITDEAALDRWVQLLSQADYFAFDTETTDLNAQSARLVGVSFAVAPGKAAYVPFGHDYLGAPMQLSENLVLQKLSPVLSDSRIKKIGQNLKYDMQVLSHYQLVLNGIAYDTMLESYVLDSVATNHNMDALALKYLGWRTISFEEIAGKGSHQLTFNQIDLQQAAMYAAEDADVTLRLHQTLWPRLNQETGLPKIFNEIEMPLVPVLARIESNGVLIAAEQLKMQSHELKARLQILTEEAFQLAGIDFNLNSPKQLQEILFDKLKLPVLQKTPKGQPSTADAVLQELALDFLLPKLIIEYRSLSKLISTYTDRLPEQINARTGRVHTCYHQAGTATGRLSSSDPNLQNIPVRTAEGRRIRQAFIAPRGYKILSADYSQIELRLMAHISQDSQLLSAFKQNLDIHQATAAEVWGVPLNDVTSDMRRGAKAINFGLIYGMSSFGLARQLGIDRKAAQEYIERYFARYPGVKTYMDETRLKARERGFVETLWGRRLYLPDINSRQIPRQKAAERTAINAPLQGSAADIIKLAMIRLDRQLSEMQIDAKIIMQVHDELVLEVAESILPQVMEMVRAQMTQAIQLDVPLVVAVGSGDNWDQASAH